MSTQKTYKELIEADVVWLDSLAITSGRSASVEYEHIRSVLLAAFVHSYPRSSEAHALLQQQVPWSKMTAMERDGLIENMHRTCRDLIFPLIAGDSEKAQAEFFNTKLGVPYIEQPADETVFCGCLWQLGTEEKLTELCRLHNEVNGLLECHCLGLPPAPSPSGTCPRHPVR